MRARCSPPVQTTQIAIGAIGKSDDQRLSPSFSAAFNQDPRFRVVQCSIAAGFLALRNQWPGGMAGQRDRQGCCVMAREPQAPLPPRGGPAESLVARELMDMAAQCPRHRAAGMEAS